MARRITGDAVGCAALALLLALLMYVLPDHAAPYQSLNVFFGVYVVLTVGGYICWSQMDKRMARPRWLLQAVTSVGIGVVFFFIDTLVGSLQGHHWQPSSPFSAAAATGIMFGITLLICPGYTFIAFSGWARSLVQSDAVTPAP